MNFSEIKTQDSKFDELFHLVIENRVSDDINRMVRHQVWGQANIQVTNSVTQLVWRDIYETSKERV